MPASEAPVDCFTFHLPSPLVKLFAMVSYETPSSMGKGATLMPKRSKEPRRLVLLGEAGLASSSGDIGRVAFLVHQAAVFLNARGRLQMDLALIRGPNSGDGR